jgi:hypothetical protein
VGGGGRSKQRSPTHPNDQIHPSRNFASYTHSLRLAAASSSLTGSLRDAKPPRSDMCVSLSRGEISF